MAQQPQQNPQPQFSQGPNSPPRVDANEASDASRLQAKESAHERQFSTKPAKPLAKYDVAFRHLNQDYRITVEAQSEADAWAIACDTLTAQQPAQTRRDIHPNPKQCQRRISKVSA